jgi:transcriptional regulator with XRE-family HTH domain
MNIPPDIMAAVLAQNVRALRVYNGISQGELARRANVSRTQITELEKRRRRMSDAAVDRIASALDVSPENLRSASYSTDRQGVLHQFTFLAEKPRWWSRIWRGLRWVWNGGMEETW